MLKLDFLKTALVDYRVGAIAKSSRYVIGRVLKCIDGPLDLIVEYGPGEGIMTKALLSKLSPQGKLVAIESNKEFAGIMGDMQDPRLEVIHGTATEADSMLANLPRADLIISSIPFSFLSPPEREKIISDAKEFLKPGGRLIVFHQYSLLTLKTIKKHFGAVSILFEPRNILPCFIIIARKS
ncbi:MAG: methyltransferase domain-containing protein [Candidatus Liptonbacteria bacterium]